MVADICTFPDAGIVEDLYLDRLRAGKPVAKPELRRFTIDPDGGTGRRTSCSSTRASSCRGSTTGAATSARIATSGASAPAGSGYLDRIVAADLTTRTTTVWSEPGCYPGEPVFVAEPGATEENEGVLLSVVLDASAGTSFLLVLDAATLDERARAEFPHHIPFGFHGQFATGLIAGRFPTSAGG